LVVKQKTYTVTLGFRIADALANEFITKNGFKLMKVDTGSVSDYTKTMTIIYDDLDKPQVFDNDYDRDWQRFQKGKLLPKNIVDVNTCQHLNYFLPESHADGLYCTWHCVDCNKDVHNLEELELRNAKLRLKKIGLEVEDLDSLSFVDIIILIQQETGKPHQEVLLVGE